MGVISMEKVDHLYWLGRYTERVYTTLRVFFHIYDRIIEQPEGMYSKYCEKLDIPDIYTSNRQFVQSYLFGEYNPDSVYSNMKRAYDNAVVLRDELSTTVLSYVQLALDTFDSCRKTTAPLLELQQVIDHLLAFWGGGRLCGAGGLSEYPEVRKICGEAGSLHPAGLSREGSGKRVPEAVQPSGKDGAFLQRKKSGAHWGDHPEGRGSETLLPGGPGVPGRAAHLSGRREERKMRKERGRSRTEKAVYYRRKLYIS